MRSDAQVCTACRTHVVMFARGENLPWIHDDSASTPNVRGSGNVECTSDHNSSAAWADWKPQLRLGACPTTVTAPAWHECTARGFLTRQKPSRIRTPKWKHWTETEPQTIRGSTHPKKNLRRTNTRLITNATHPNQTREVPGKLFEPQKQRKFFTSVGCKTSVVHCRWLTSLLELPLYLFVVRQVQEFELLASSLLESRVK